MAASQDLTRREFIGRAAVGAAAGVLFAARGGHAQSQQRPNILWIMTDEHRADALHCYGNPWAVSPNLDKLAARGVLFRNAFVQSPVCTPSRASMLTGKYPHTCGVLENNYHLNLTPWHRRQIGEHIEKMGPEAYEKMLAQVRKNSELGMARMQEKYHAEFGPMVKSAFANPAQLEMQFAKQLGIIGQGPQHKILPEILADVGYHTAAIGKLHHNSPTPGFQEVIEVPEEEYANHFGLRKDLDESQYGLIKHPALGVVFAGTFPAPASETPESKWTDAAIEFLNRPADGPFLLHMSYLAPHTPVLPPEPYASMFDPKDMKIPQPTEEELLNAPRCDLRKIRNVFTEGKQRQISAKYYGFTAFVDDQIGRLLDALAASPHADNTIVVFNADHGNLLGEHDLYQKMVFYDITTRVPFIMSWPGKLPEGKTVDSLVEMIDIAPTLLELAGVAMPNDIQGVSLRGVMEDAAVPAHEAVFSERYEGPHDLEWFLRGEASGTIRRMIRTEEWFMAIDYPHDPLYGPDGALFSVENDPEQIHNLYYDDRHRNVVEKLTARIAEWVERTTPAEV